MEDLLKSVPFIAENWEIIALVAGAALAVFGVIAKRTANKTDDKIFEALSGLKNDKPADKE
jgi:hypothetical protein